jgi:rubrerythrin
MAGTGHARVLDACRRVEEGAARLYHRLAHVHRADGAIAALWTKTGREEENHARQVQMVIRPRAPIASGLRVEYAKVERALAMVQALIEGVDSAPPPVGRALEEAITLEKTLAQFHAEYAVEFAEPAYRQLFRSMMAADRDHVGALEAALEALVARRGGAGPRDHGPLDSPSGKQDNLD